MKVDQGAIDNDKLNIAYCHITAPVSGRVGLRQVDPGNYVQSSSTNGLVMLTQLDPISVIFSVTEDNLPEVMRQLHAGATLPVDAYDRSNTTKLATGKVAAVDSQINTTTGTVNIRALFPNPERRAVPQPVRQRAAAGGHAAQRDARAGCGGAAGRARRVRLCHQRQRYGVGEDR